jgi:uncharacterized protein (DUF885 family)
MRYFFFFLLLATATISLGQPNPGFNRMLDSYYEKFLALNPTVASSKGDYRYNDQLENPISQPYRDAMKQVYRQYLDSLKRYPENQLSTRDKLSHQIFQYDLQKNLEGFKFPTYLTPVSQMSDFRIQFSQMGAGSSVHPFKTVKDYDDFLKRMDGFVAWTDTAITNMQKGLALRYVQPVVVMEKVLPQIKAMLVDDVTKSLFYTPIKNLPASFSPTEKRRLTAAYTVAIQQKIIPAYNKLYTFVQNDYLPNCRKTVAISAVPNGKEQYDYLVKTWTTTNLTPDEIHALGLSEVKRIRQEMEAIKQTVGFTGDLNAFFKYVATDPKFLLFKTEEEVVARYQTIYATMKPNLPKLFNKVPKTAFEIRPIEKYRAATSAAHYMGGTPDGSRPGVFYFPVLDATRYSYWRMEDLFLHEAIPGHHYQISLQTENESVPGLQKIGRYGAYVEGWGLYAERLGKELGLYNDPFEMLGFYQGEMHRAIRLIRACTIKAGPANRPLPTA